MVAGPVLALSCLPWTHLNAWEEAAGSDKLYLIVRGDLIFDQGAVPQVDWNNQQQTPPLTVINAYMTGHQLSQRGFKHSFEGTVTIELSCLGPWCAGLISGETYVAFLEKRGSELILATNPCGGFAFPATDTIQKDLTGCMRGGACRP